MSKMTLHQYEPGERRAETEINQFLQRINGLGHIDIMRDLAALGTKK